MGFSPHGATQLMSHKVAKRASARIGRRKIWTRYTKQFWQWLKTPIAVLLNGVGGLFLFSVVVSYLLYRNPSE